MAVPQILLADAVRLERNHRVVVALMHAGAVLPFLAALGVVVAAQGWPSYASGDGMGGAGGAVSAWLVTALVAAMLMLAFPTFMWLRHRRTPALDDQARMVVDYNLTVLLFLSIGWAGEMLTATGPFADLVRAYARIGGVILTWAWVGLGLTGAALAVYAGRFSYPPFLAWPFTRRRGTASITPGSRVPPA